MTTVKTNDANGVLPTCPASPSAEASSSPQIMVGMQSRGDDSPDLPGNAFKQDYNVVLDGCRAGCDDDCIVNCQTANWLAGHLASLIMELKQRGYIDEQGYII